MAGDRSMQCRIRSLIGSLFCVAMYLRVVSSFSRTASRDDARAGRKSERALGLDEKINSRKSDLTRVCYVLWPNKS
jgi:hypothetical protein